MFTSIEIFTEFVLLMSVFRTDGTVQRSSQDSWSTQDIWSINWGNKKGQYCTKTYRFVTYIHTYTLVQLKL